MIIFIVMIIDYNNHHQKLMEHENDRLIEQSVEILIYDYRNKYELLKSQNLDKDKINTIMDNYQKVRIKEFIDTYKTIKSFYSPRNY